MSYKLFITGATGFVGTNLIPFLSDNDIEVFDRNKVYSSLALQSIDTVIHLAGKAHDLKNVSNADEYYVVNYELTRMLYDLFLLSDAKKFIFISSVKAAADDVNGILTEEVTPNPSTHYGKSKLMAEEYIRSQPLPEGKSYYILRPCMIHGPGNKGNLNLLYSFVQKGIPYPLAAFSNKRSFLSIKNFCFVIRALLERNVASGIYNVADNEALSTNEVVDILAKSLNRKPKLWTVPVTIIKMLASAGDLFKLPLNSERLNKLTANYVISNKKIRHALNEELPLTITEGLVITANSFTDTYRQ